MLRTEAARKSAIKGAIVSLAACLLSACAFQSDVCGKEPTGKLTYYIASVREKKIQGNWGDRAQSVQRQETADGRWALETVILGDTLEGLADAKVLDSAGRVIWEDRIGDRAVLSPIAPAFAVSSSEGSGVVIYNLDAGLEPVFSARQASGEGVRLSRDGTVFGFADVAGFSLVSIRGDLLGRIAFPESFEGSEIEIADSGRYVALAGTDPVVPIPDSSQAPPGDVLTRVPLNQSRPHAGDSLTGSTRPPREGPQSSQETALRALRISWPNARVIVFDQAGKTVGGAHLEETLPPGVAQLRQTLRRGIALSGDDPPAIAAAADNLVLSLWTCTGRRLWVDSTTFAGPAWVHLAALCVLPDLQVLAAAGHSQDDAALCLWNRSGVLEARVPLPKSIGLLRPWIPWPAQDDASVVFKIDAQTITIRLAGEGP